MEQKVLEKIVIDTSKTIYAFFLKRNVAENDAKDLTSETILSILQATQKILNEEAIYGYIFNASSNIYKKYLNKKKNHVFVPINENDFIENSTFIKDEQLERLHRELAMLPSLYRQCTILYYYQQYGLKEISEKLNISLEMTKYYLFKTRKTLKEGIVMEREFGQRSYNPETFYFVNFYYGNYNEERQIYLIEKSVAISY